MQKQFLHFLLMTQSIEYKGKSIIEKQKHIMKHLKTGGKDVSIKENKGHFFICYMLGFLIGIFYANMLSRQYVMTGGIFNDSFLNGYMQVEVLPEDYIWYILRMRLIPLAVIAVLGMTKLRKVTVLGSLLWGGFSHGILTVASVIKMGIKGLVFCLLGMTPQIIFYVAGDLVLLWQLYSYPKIKWSVWKVIFILLTFAMGIIMEVYVNPILMKLYIGNVI